MMHSGIAFIVNLSDQGIIKKPYFWNRFHSSVPVMP